MPRARQAPPTPGESDEIDPVAIPGTRMLLADDTPADLSPGERLVAMLEGMGTDDKTTVRLYRRRPNSTALDWCQNYSVPEFLDGDFESVRRVWGAGDYEIRVYGAGGLASRENVNIAARMDHAPAAAPNANPEIAAMLKALADSQSKMLEVLAHRPDPMVQFQQTAELLKTLQGSAAPVAPVKSTAETLTELMLTMRTMKELSGELTPPAPTSDDPMSMLPSILGVVQQAMAQRNGGGGAVPMVALPPSMAAPVAPAAPAPNPDPQSTVQPEPDDMPNPLAILVLRGKLQLLVSMAAKAEPPETGGDLIYDELPDDMLPFLALPNWFDLLVEIEPSVREYQSWFKDAKAHADKLFALPDGDDEAGA